MPMLPPAPLRLSTTTCCFHASVSLCPTRRATSSVGPIGGNGTINRIGRDGYCCPAAGDEKRAIADNAATITLLTVQFIVSPQCSSPTKQVMNNGDGK